MATATFTDIWSGPTQMVLETVRTTKRGERVTAYRWVKAPDARGCIVTGLPTYASVARAVAVAKHHALFSNVVG